MIFLAIAVCVQGSITEPLAIHTLAQALKSSSLQSSGWTNLQDPDLNQMTYQSVVRESLLHAAKKVKQCGPTSAELKPADVKGTFHPSGPKFLNVWQWIYAKREVKPFGFLAVMGLLQG